MTWDYYDIKKEYKESERNEGFYANKPELEKLYKAVEDYLRNERSLEGFSGREEEEDFSDDFRKELIQLLKKIGYRLNY